MDTNGAKVLKDAHMNTTVFLSLQYYGYKQVLPNSWQN